MLAPQWHTQGKAQNRPKHGLGVPHASPLWVEQHVCAQTEVVGSEGVWEWSGRHSPRAHVQHWVVHSWEVGYTTGNDACSRLAQNGESDLPQWRHLWWQLQLH